MAECHVKLSRTNRLIVPMDIRRHLGVKSGDRFLPIAIPAGVLFRHVPSEGAERTSRAPLPDTEFSVLVRKDVENDDSLPDILKERIIERAKMLRVTRTKKK